MAWCSNSLDVSVPIVGREANQCALSHQVRCGLEQVDLPPVEIDIGLRELRLRCRFVVGSSQRGEKHRDQYRKEECQACTHVG